MRKMNESLADLAKTGILKPSAQKDMTSLL